VLLSKTISSVPLLAHLTHAYKKRIIAYPGCCGSQFAAARTPGPWWCPQAHDAVLGEVALLGAEMKKVDELNREVAELRSENELLRIACKGLEGSRTSTSLAIKQALYAQMPIGHCAL